MTFRAGILTVGSLLLAAGFGCRQSNDSLLVRIDNRDSITVPEFQSRVATQWGDQASSVSFQNKRQLLHTMIDEHLKVLSALDNKIDQDEMVSAQLAEASSGVLLEVAQERYMVSQFVNNEHVARYRQHRGQQLKVQNIVLRYSDGPFDKAPRNRTRAGALADSIARVITDSNFSRIAEHLSDYRDNKSGKGFTRVELFKYGTIPTAYEDVAFATPAGSVTKPIDLPGAILIGLVQAITTDSSVLKKPMSDDEIRAALRGKLEGADRAAYQRAYRQFTDSLYEAAHVAYQTAVLDTLAARYPKGGQPKATARAFDESDAKLVLATFGTNGRLTIGDFVRRIRPGTNTGNGDRAAFRDLADLIVRDMLFQSFAEGQNLKDSDEFQRKWRLKRQEILIGRITDQKLPRPDTASVAELRRFYEDHFDEYVVPGSVTVQQVDAKMKTALEQMLRLIRSGVPFDKAADSVRPADPTLTVQAQATYSGTQKDELVQAAFRLDRDDVSGIIARKDGGYSAIRVVDKKEPVRQTFESVKRRVESQYRTAMRQHHEQTWLDGMKKDLTIVIYENLLK